MNLNVSLKSHMHLTVKSVIERQIEESGRRSTVTEQLAYVGDHRLIGLDRLRILAWLALLHWAVRAMCISSLRFSPSSAAYRQLGLNAVPNGQQLVHKDHRVAEQFINRKRKLLTF